MNPEERLPTIPGTEPEEGKRVEIQTITDPEINVDKGDTLPVELPEIEGEPSEVTVGLSGKNDTVNLGIVEVPQRLQEQRIKEDKQRNADTKPLPVPVDEKNPFSVARQGANPDMQTINTQEEILKASPHEKFSVRGLWKKLRGQGN